VIAQFVQDRGVRAFCARIEKTHCVLYNLVYRSSSVERSIGLAFTTLIIDLASLAHAAHPTQAVKPTGRGSDVAVTSQLKVAAAAGTASVTAIRIRR
jgi:hypothetical protein